MTLAADFANLFPHGSLLQSCECTTQRQNTQQGQSWCVRGRYRPGVVGRCVSEQILYLTECAQTVPSEYRTEVSIPLSEPKSGTD